MKMINVFHICVSRNWLSETKSLCSLEDAREFALDILEEEISMLEKELSQDYQEIGFCHNDLQYGNIMIDEETRSITLIVSFIYHYRQLYISWTLTVVLV